MNTPNNKRRKESQQRIESAFITLLQDTPLNKISVTDICKLAEVNRTTFYANYPDIYALGEAVQKRLEKEVLDLYQGERETHPIEHDFLKLFRHIKENQLFYKTYFKLAKGDHLRHIIGYDEQAAAAYYGGQHIDYHIAFFGYGLTAVIQKWLLYGCQESPEEMCAIIEAEYRK